MATISVRNLTKKYGNITANDCIDLDVERGEYLVILGPTGAGKTTLLRCIAGLERGYGGSILINGEDIGTMEADERPVAFLGQEYSLFPHMTVWQNTVFGPSMQGLGEREIDAVGKEMLDMVHLQDRMDAYPGELSGGMKQRNALARALAYDAEVLLLDEPLRALDARLRIDLRSEIRRLCRYLKRTTIHVTHDQEEALVVADRIAVMRNGKVEQIGTPRDIYESPVSPFVQHFMGGANFVTGRRTGESEMTFVSDDGRMTVETARKLPAGVPVTLSIKHDYTVLWAKGNVKKKNTYPGTIVQRQFAGAFTTFEVETAFGVNLVSRVPSSVEMKFEPGMEVYAELPPGMLVPFECDAKALKKELEVE